MLDKRLQWSGAGTIEFYIPSKTSFGKETKPQRTTISVTRQKTKQKRLHISKSSRILLLNSSIIIVSDTTEKVKLHTVFKDKITK